MQLIELLEHPTLSEAAVAAFDVLSIEFPQLHLPVIKHFFKQKLFQLCLKGLWHKLESYSEKHLSAFVFVLKLTPHQVLKNEIQKVSRSDTFTSNFFDLNFIFSDWTNHFEMPYSKQYQGNYGCSGHCEALCNRTK